MKILHITEVERSLLPFTEIVTRGKEKLGFPESENGEYVSLRIPGIVEAADGSLIAYFECRTGGDWSAIDLCMRRSTDGGRSWSERSKPVSGKGRMTTNNPVMIPDGDRLVFLYCEGYKRLFCKISEDCGKSWSQARELTEAVEHEMGDTFWSNLAVGPGHGIRTQSGRLIVPIWFAINKSDIFAHHPSVVTTLYSDDRGESWHLGEILTGDGVEDPNESTVAELSDGRLMLNVRNISPCRRRAVAYSSDGGAHFTPMEFAPDLADPKCMGSMCRAGERLLFSNCNSTNGRIDLTLSVLDENARVTERMLLCDTGGYSDLCYSEAGKRVYALFECDDVRKLCCAEIDLEED